MISNMKQRIAALLAEKAKARNGQQFNPGTSLTQHPMGTSLQQPPGNTMLKPPAMPKPTAPIGAAPVGGMGVQHGQPAPKMGMFGKLKNRFTGV